MCEEHNPLWANVNLFAEPHIGEHGYLFSGNELGNTFCSSITDLPASPERERWRAGAPPARTGPGRAGGRPALVRQRFTNLPFLLWFGLCHVILGPKNRSGPGPSESWTLEGEVTGKFSKAFPPAFTRAISWLTRIRFFMPEKRYQCSF